MSVEPPQPRDLGPEGAPGRHGRARELARRQAEGEELGSYDSRLLSAHLEACEECRDWVDALPAEQQAEPAVAATANTPERSSEGSPDRDRDREGELDAMGKPKRRKVIGQTYGPTKARQFALYAMAIGVIVLIFIGAQFAIDKLDKPPAHDKAQAPWAQPNSPQLPPQH